MCDGSQRFFAYGSSSRPWTPTYFPPQPTRSIFSQLKSSDNSRGCCRRIKMERREAYFVENISSCWMMKAWRGEMQVMTLTAYIQRASPGFGRLGHTGTEQPHEKNGLVLLQNVPRTPLDTHEHCRAHFSILRLRIPLVQAKMHIL